MPDTESLPFLIYARRIEMESKEAKLSFLQGEKSYFICEAGKMHESTAVRPQQFDLRWRANMNILKTQFLGFDL